MENSHRDILRRNAVRLTSDLDVTPEFLSHLKQDRIVSDSNFEELTLQTKTPRQRASEFQLMIVKKGPRAWNSLIGALVKTSQTDLAHVLDPILTSQLEQRLGEESSSPVRNHPPPPRQRVTVDNSNNAFMKIAIPHVSQYDLQRFDALKKQDDVYGIEHSPRGRFVIINNQSFRKHGDREGSHFDMYNLGQLCKKLDFTEVNKGPVSGRSYINLTAKELRKEIADLSRLDFSASDALIFCIMSHGAQGVVFGVDGVEISIEEDICAAFSGANCPYLSGKPKIFIIQACQGVNAVTGVPQADSPEDAHDAQPGLSEPSSEATMERAMQKLRIGDSEGRLPVKIPEKGDVIVAYSTVNGYKSWRIPELGSWFVRAIVDVFGCYADEEDLLSLFTRVNKKVSELKTHYAAGDTYIQMPRVDSTLRKKLFFLPGYLTTQHQSPFS